MHQSNRLFSRRLNFSQGKGNKGKSYSLLPVGVVDVKVPLSPWAHYVKGGALLQWQTYLKPGFNMNLCFSKPFSMQELKVLLKAVPASQILPRRKQLSKFLEKKMKMISKYQRSKKKRGKLLFYTILLSHMEGSSCTSRFFRFLGSVNCIFFSE